MSGAALGGGFADPARDGAAAFRAALEAMARPGSAQTIDGVRPPAPAGPAAGALLLTLCGADTGLYLAASHDAAELRAWIAFHTGAPLVAAGQATFALGSWAALQPLARFAAGTAIAPERSATLIVDGAGAGAGAGAARLTGPGIAGEMRRDLPDPAALAAGRGPAPLGVDLFFTSGARLTGLPRSTRVTEAG